MDECTKKNLWPQTYVSDRVRSPMSLPNRQLTPRLAVPTRTSSRIWTQRWTNCPRTSSHKSPRTQCFRPLKCRPSKRPCRPLLMKPCGSFTTTRPKHVSLTISVLLVLVCRTQRLLWACIVPWKKASKTKYSAVSTLTFVCYCPTSCIAPRPPLCSYATRTRPRAARATR